MRFGIGEKVLLTWSGTRDVMADVIASRADGDITFEAYQELERIIKNKEPLIVADHYDGGYLLDAGPHNVPGVIEEEFVNKYE